MKRWPLIVSKKLNAVVSSLLFAVLTAGTVTAAIPSESAGSKGASTATAIGASPSAGAAEVLEILAPARRPSSTKSVGSERLETVGGLSVLSWDMEGVVLRVDGTTASGESDRVWIELPIESWWVEPEPFEKFVDEEDGCTWVSHRILYFHEGQTHIAGVMGNHGRPGEESRDGCGELNNVQWGYDVKKQSFWVQTHPSRMMPYPKEFNRRDWTGKRFRIPLPLKRFRAEETKQIIENRGGVVVGAEGPVDVVLIPDKLKFTWSRPRNKETEDWIRKGARILWEKDFPLGGR